MYTHIKKFPSLYMINESYIIFNTLFLFFFFASNNFNEWKTSSKVPSLESVVYCLLIFYSL